MEGLTSAFWISAIIELLIIALIAIAANKLEQIKSEIDSMIYYLKEIERKTPDENRKEERKEKDGDWKCSCGAMNRKYETSCHSCGKSRSEARK